MRSPARASTSSPSTTTWPSATPNGWAASTSSSASPSASSCTSSTTTSGAQQYACDVTYGTNNELGFDYLRDNMKMRAPEMVQRGHHYAIVDEVDSILIDEARTPLIISGPVEDRAELYVAVDELMKGLVAEHDTIENELKASSRPRRQGQAEGAAQGAAEDQGLVDLDEKQRQASFTEAGNERLEQLLNEKDLLKGGSLYDIESVTVVHHANQALKAHKLFHARPRLHRQGRRGRHHRRVHRPHDAGPALFGRPAPGAGSQGARDDPAREPDARLHHLPELLPPLQEARRHDRHGRHRGQRVHRHLPARRARDPDQPADRPHRRARRGLPHGQGEDAAPSSPRSPTATAAASPFWSAPYRSRSRRRCRGC